MTCEELLTTLTLEQKCALLSGADTFCSRALPGQGIPSLWLSDGPSGVRKQEGASDHLGINPSAPATCFPTAVTLAGSWDSDLLEEVGRAMGQEAAAQDVDVLLAPGLNIKRSPLCGRNFEYYSEDSILAGKLAAAMIRGIQAGGAAACPKHFAVNNQETRRMVSDSTLDERTLREIYLTGFEIAVKEGHPRTIMSSYNLVNGTYICLRLPGQDAGDETACFLHIGPYLTGDRETVWEETVKKAISLSASGRNCGIKHELPRPTAIFPIYGLDWNVEPLPMDRGLAVFSVVGREDPYGFGMIEEKIPALTETLGEENVSIRVYDHLGHGFGLGTETVAKNWLQEAVDFWEAHR